MLNDDKEMGKYNSNNKRYSSLTVDQGTQGEKVIRQLAESGKVLSLKIRSQQHI